MRIHFITKSALMLLTIAATHGCALFYQTPGTALAEAAHRGDTTALRRLAAAGADPNQYDATGQTALHWAARGGHPFGPHRCRGERDDRADVISLLIALGADPNAVDRRKSIPGGSSGWTPLHVALHHEQFTTAARLLEHGANPNIRTRQGRSAMAMAADEGAPRELLEQLLDTGFDPGAARVPSRR